MSKTETAYWFVNTVIDRYQEVVARSIPELSESEWMACADALDGIALWRDAGHPAMVWAKVEGADQLSDLGAKWGIDAPALVARLRALPYAQSVALVDVVERLWADPGAGFRVRLRELGAVLDAEPRRRRADV